MNRRAAYEPGSGHHKLWLTIGGRLGHGGLYGLDLDEGEFQQGVDRRWEVSVLHPDEVKQQREDRKVLDLERRENEHVEKLIAALHKHPAGQTARQLKAESRLNQDNFLRALAVLKQVGRVEEILIPTKRGSFDGFRLAK